MRTPARITVSPAQYTSPAYVPYTNAVPIDGSRILGDNMLVAGVKVSRDEMIVVTYRQDCVTLDEVRNLYDGIKRSVRNIPVLLLPDSVNLYTCTREDLDAIIDRLMTARNELTQSTREVST